MPSQPLTDTGVQAYATRTDLAAYVLDEGVTLPATTVEQDRLLERASLDVDKLAGQWSLEPNGLKFGEVFTTNEKGLSVGQRAALARATCAQAVAILRRRAATSAGGAANDPSVRSISGPDFDITYSDGGARGATIDEPAYSSVAYAELAGAGLVRATAAWV